MYIYTNVYKPEIVAENETHKILLDFELQMDHLNPARRSDLMIIKKKAKLVDFTFSADHKVTNRENKKDKYLDKELKKSFSIWAWQWYQL